MSVTIRRVPSSRWRSAAAGEPWLPGNRLLFLHSKPINRIKVGSFSFVGDTVYLTVSDGDLERYRDFTTDLEPDLYIQLSEDLRRASNEILKRDAVLLNMPDFFRVFSTERERLQNDEEWRFRASVIRRVHQDAEWMDSGVYEIRRLVEVYEDEFFMGEMQRRTPDFASGGITKSERDLFHEQMRPYREHARRTAGVNPLTLKLMVDALYERIGLEAPHLVVLPNPLSAAIAGAFASVMLFNEKHRVHENDRSKYLANNGMISRAVFLTTSLQAAYGALDSIDQVTSREINDATAQSFETARFADDCIRFLESRELTNVVENFGPRTGRIDAVLNEFEREAEFTDPDWKLGMQEIYDAINSTLFDKDEFAASAEEQSLEAALDTLIEHFGAESPVLRKALDMSLNGQKNLILEATISPVVVFCKNILNIHVPAFDIYERWEELVLEGAAFVMHQEFCFVSDFPESMELDDRGRLHCDDGPAIKWRDGWKIYYWHGTAVPARIIETPETITVDAINYESNQEVRRVMIERYGAGRYILDSDAEEVQQDEYGILYRQHLPDDEPITIVRVKNSTPETDGSIKEYFLRVPPDTETAKEGVAWTFGLEANDYKPDIES